jgi:hypothetical protein
MSAPKSSINALFPEVIDCGFGVAVHPLTLAHYALLEKINSYLVNADHAPDSLEVIKTLYICTHSAREVMDNFSNLDSLAFEWAENLPPMMNDIIVKAILKQINAMSKVVPVVDDNGKKKVTGTDS